MTASQSDACVFFGVGGDLAYSRYSQRSRRWTPCGAVRPGMTLLVDDMLRISVTIKKGGRLTTVFPVPGSLRARSKNLAVERIGDQVGHDFSVLLHTPQSHP
jgi:hypothetical protein